MQIQTLHEIIETHFKESNLPIEQRYSLAIQIQRNQILFVGLPHDEKVKYKYGSI